MMFAASLQGRDTKWSSFHKNLPVSEKLAAKTKITFGRVI